MAISKTEQLIRECEFPDIAEFLKLSRMFVRQIELLSKQQIPEEYTGITKETVAKVNAAAEKWLKG